MDLNVIHPNGETETLVRVVDGKPVIVPPPSRPPAATPNPAP